MALPLNNLHRRTCSIKIVKRVFLFPNNFQIKTNFDEILIYFHGSLYMTKILYILKRSDIANSD